MKLSNLNITESFKTHNFKEVSRNLVNTTYEFEINGIEFTAYVAGYKNEYDVDFGSRDENGLNFTELINKVDATDVVQTVISIVLDHYEKLDKSKYSEIFYYAMPTAENNKKENRRFDLYLRQANRALKNMSYNVDITNNGNKLTFKFII